MESGRLINVFEGDYRNDVYPLQVALASDICINDIIGASAALEVASVGKRCILLNEHNYKLCMTLFTIQQILFLKISLMH